MYNNDNNNNNNANNSYNYNNYLMQENFSDRNWLITLLLAWFAGVLGLHNFYVGRTARGFVYMFTLGFFGIGVIVDLILIVMKKFKDREGRLVVNSKF